MVMRKFVADFDENLLASVVYFSHDSIIVTTPELDDPGPQIVYVNPGFTRMTGYTSEEVMGKTPQILQGPRTDRSVLNRLRQTLEAGEVFFGQAINYRKDGSEFWNEWHIESILDGQGVLTHYVAIQRDVTERVKVQLAVEQKNAALLELIEQIEIEKKKIKEAVAMNVDAVLLPALKQLRRKGSRIDKKYLDILETNLHNLTSSFGLKSLGDKNALSPREIEIADMIRHGSSSKDICALLNLSFKTVETHRNHIRKKLGITNTATNLTTFLKNL